MDMDITNRDGAAADTTDRTQTSSDVAAKPLAVVEYFDVAHRGPGWYWHSSLTDDAVGPFVSANDATDAASEHGYRVTTKAAA